VNECLCAPQFTGKYVLPEAFFTGMPALSGEFFSRAAPAIEHTRREKSTPLPPLQRGGLDGQYCSTWFLMK
jgi:hypothetical protein